MRQILLFGGSFDPIHNGHLEIALSALKQTKAEEVWFVLAALSPFKEDAPPFEARASMVKLMINPYKRLKLCTIEQTLPIPSYSIDTITALKKQHPEVSFSWLIGSDQIPDLPKWKNYEALCEMVKFVVYPRPSHTYHHAFEEIKGLTYDISSTDIRNGRSLDTSPKILNAMMEHGLYLKLITQSKMSEKRFKHTLRVTELALELAKHHHIDENRVYLASMVHDWCKEWDKKDLEIEMKKINPDLLKLHPALYHGFAAASVLSKHYYVRDKQVLNAIRGHVSGASTSDIGMILYIADKCERGRDYDSEPLIVLSKKNLRAGFKKVKQESKRYRGQ
ncbi:nicotinate-nucleotide adenylyltransferase [Erysipelothrix larvae]|uniref:Probable nicotinate-nucleotide adenylyltransferase n=1 Tax=Erysipelothrix larvae TaxID=1514105 RepID=A0A0X8GZI7_9FIRM|nr:nicotinate (nicotinamide) nucleotide adenylyltransferase [Erysipelothrix larvae]AMC93291.1 nicotinate-nucleotide adenylyltransferase [Erysipelothrix larvae]